MARADCRSWFSEKPQASRHNPRSAGTDRRKRLSHAQAERDQIGCGREERPGL